MVTTALPRRGVAFIFCFFEKFRHLLVATDRAVALRLLLLLLLSLLLSLLLLVVVVSSGLLDGWGEIETLLLLLLSLRGMQEAACRRRGN